jgi:hypothetical protein
MRSLVPKRTFLLLLGLLALNNLLPYGLSNLMVPTLITVAPSWETDTVNLSMLGLGVGMSVEVMDTV